ncbi:MAG: hypothetical protein WCS09_07175 [Pseudomonadota bacterium]
MMTGQKLRGRPPKKPESRALRAAKDILEEASTLHAGTDFGDSESLIRALTSGKDVETTVLGEWKKNDPTLPHSLIFQLESLSPEFATPEQAEAVLDEYKIHCENRQGGRLLGAQTTASRAEQNFHFFARHPLVQQAVDKINHPTRHSVSCEALRLFEKWDTLGLTERRQSLKTIWRRLNKAARAKQLDKAGSQ